jgi:hypothetical protein
MKTIDFDNGVKCRIYANGDKHWYLNDKLHRTDGHAVEYLDGDKEWWIKGKIYIEEEFDMVKEVL